MPNRPKWKKFKHKPDAKTRVKGKKLPPAMEERKWRPGQSGRPGGRPPGKTLLTRIKELLQTRSVKKINGKLVKNMRFDDVAEAFVTMMESGSFVHLKEFIDREEGKVPTRLAGAEGETLKLYAGVPLEGEEAP